MIWDSYPARTGCHDGYLDGSGGPRSLCREIVRHVEELGLEGLGHLQRTAEISLRNQGITFTVYSDQRGTEKILPFDILPRLVSAEEWSQLESGLTQRMRALNLLLTDLYGPQRILKDGIIPSDLVVTSPHFCRAMPGITVPGGVFIHVSGTDLIQNEDGQFLVLEDNVRVPSGVSYVLENRIVMSRVLPDLLQLYGVRPVDHYPQLLFESLRSVSPCDAPRIALLTPGIYNSAYFEHSFLAAQMGIQLVEGRDLVVDQDVVYMKTTSGMQRLDVLYRRIDDAFLDPIAFRPDSLLGVPGLMNAYRAGNVVLANAPGTGVVDDKAMYAYIPRAIRYYLSEEPILAQVPTYLCREAKDCAYVLEHLEELVLKPTDGSGGYGLVIGPHAPRAQLEEARAAVRAAPEKYVAQPVQMLSTLPAYVGVENHAGLRPRHVDLRPFSVYGAQDRISVLSGGLTRVALREGSLVVNSSQGGGSKDTWVLRDLEDRGPVRDEGNAHA